MPTGEFRALVVASARTLMSRRCNDLLDHEIVSSLLEPGAGRLSTRKDSIELVVAAGAPILGRVLPL
jgi:hypothetical protein